MHEQQPRSARELTIPWVIPFDQWEMGVLHQRWRNSSVFLSHPSTTYNLWGAVYARSWRMVLSDGARRCGEETHSLAYVTGHKVCRSLCLILMITKEYPPQRRISITRRTADLSCGNKPVSLVSYPVLEQWSCKQCGQGSKEPMHGPKVWAPPYQGCSRLLGRNRDQCWFLAMTPFFSEAAGYVMAGQSYWSLLPWWAALQGWYLLCIWVCFPFP